MIRLLVLCEGDTEREFCKTVVAPHLRTRDVELSATLLSKLGRKQGGIVPWAEFRAELLMLARGNDAPHVAVLVDFYKLKICWPGRVSAADKSKSDRGPEVERALCVDLSQKLGSRFHPCVQVHEFESLLFVDPDRAAAKLASIAGIASQGRIASAMSGIRAICGSSVEDIDDRPNNAPAERLKKIVTGYNKLAWGLPAVADVGLTALRAGCPWLNRWVTRLERLGGNPHV